MDIRRRGRGRETFKYSYSATSGFRRAFNICHRQEDPNIKTKRCDSRYYEEPFWKSRAVFVEGEWSREVFALVIFPPQLDTQCWNQTEPKACRSFPLFWMEGRAHSVLQSENTLVPRKFQVLGGDSQRPIVRVPQVIQSFYLFQPNILSHHCCRRSERQQESFCILLIS